MDTSLFILTKTDFKEENACKKKEGYMLETNNKEYCHLHVHTEHSLLDGMSKIKELVARAKNFGMKALAITDHGTMTGCVEFYDECVKQGIKPIIGCEVYEAPGSRLEKGGDDRYFHLILLAKNDKGYHNLCHLVSQSNISGFYYKPRIDWELLTKYHEGLVCMSACIAGRVPQLILRGKYSEAEDWILRYKALFGDDYYLEIQNHGIREELEVAQMLKKYAKKYGVKLVCTNDVHYTKPEDKEYHEWLLCMQTKKKITDPDRMTYHGDYSLKSGDEMRALYPDTPEAFDHTLEVADKCNFKFEYGQYRMPKVVIPTEYGNDYFRYLSDEAWKGYEERYPEGNPYRSEARERIRYELSIVKQMGFAEYFLDTRKTVIWARSKNILVGPGRGSAAGSCMCYCLHITDIDPLPYGLIFERFLNPERISMPDIDVDYDAAHKNEVVAFEAQSNGYDHFAKIQTFQTMAARAVLKDVCRVAGLPVSTGAWLSGMVPDEKDMTLKKAMDLNPDLEKAVRSDKELGKVWDIALRLEDTNKSPGTHACGHIPTPVPCENLFPVAVDKKTGYLVCQYDMTQAEHLGNLKKDLLMLGNLTVIDVARQAVKREYGKDVPLWTAEVLNDKAALDVIAAGDTNGVFQLESEGMKGFMRELKPSCFEDVIAGVALYRPGPMDFIPQYIEGKYHPESVTYLTPKLEPILKNTYGIIVYQEQVMQIVRDLAGFSMGRSDVVRKAMGKKKADVMMAEKPHFIYGDKELGIPGCVERGIPENIAEKIWSQMESFASYAFNKSHAACYAAIAMQTAYLKAHYPAEFAAGLLSSVMDKKDKLAAYKAEYDKKGLHILKPDINTSGISFTASGGNVVFGLAAIRNTGSAADTIISEREEHGKFQSFSEFLSRLCQINSKAVETLVLAGAFDELGKKDGLTRRAMYDSVKPLMESYKKSSKREIPGQMSLFDLPGMEGMEGTKYAAVKPEKEFSKREFYKGEKEAAGFYISGSPLDEYRPYASAYRPVSLNLMSEERIGSFPENKMSYVNTLALIASVKRCYTKKDQQPMAFVTLEDAGQEVRAVIFPKTYARISSILAEDAPVLATLCVRHDPDHGWSVLVEDLVRIDKGRPVLWICMEDRTELNCRSRQISGFMSRLHAGAGDIAIALRREKSAAGIYRGFCVDEWAISQARAYFGERRETVEERPFVSKRKG